MKDKKPILRTKRVTITRNGDLEIKNAIIEDEGFYICSIKNSLISKYAQAQLLVNGINFYIIIIIINTTIY